MQQRSELPEGWELAQLSQIGNWFTGGTPSRSKPEYYSGTIPWIKISDLNDGIITETEEYITEKGLEDSSAKLLPVGTICVAIYGSIGKLGLLNIPATTNQACGNCIVNEKIADRLFVFYYILSQRKYLLNRGRGGTQANISNKILREWPIPLPPLAEQHRIVAAIEALFARLDATEARLARVPEIMKQFRQSVLAAACEGRLTEDWREGNPDIQNASELIELSIKERGLNINLKDKSFTKSIREKSTEPILSRKVISKDSFQYLPISWDLCYFEDIAASGKNAIKAGPFGSALTKKDYVKEGYKIYGQEQVIRGDSKYGDYYIDERKYQSLKTCKISPGDILISLVGTIGKVLILPDSCKPGIINPRLVKISLNPLVSREFIKIYLESPLAKRKLFNKAHGGTMDILNIGLIKELVIPLPPIPEQHEIVRRVDALLAFADQIETRVTATQERTGQLRQSILKQAFSGRLVMTEAEIAREGL